MAGAAESTLTRHFEHEEIRIALPESEEGPRETWYWKRLSHLDREPFGLPVPDGLSPVGIRVALEGLSEDVAAGAAGVPQHRVELLLNGHVIASEDWNGQAAVEISADETALAHMIDWVIAQTLEQANEPAARVELRVPQRHLPGQPAPVIDVVLLNWVEIDFRQADMPDPLSFPGPDAERRYLGRRAS